MNNFLIVRLSSLGDIIHTLPAFAALRKAFPSAEITWAVEPRGREILKFVPGLDHIFDSDRRWVFRLRKIREKDRVALDFQGLLKSGLLVFFSGASRRIGFNRKNLKEPWARIFYTETIPPLAEMENHVITKNLRLLQPLGLAPDQSNSAVEFPLRIPEELKKEVLQKLKSAGFKEGQRLIVLNVGASWESKRWTAQAWVEVINGVKARLTGQESLFLLWGDEEEYNLAKVIQAATGVPALPFLTIREVMALISLVSLLVSGDTFALQVADALDIPCVGLFGPTSPIRNGPFRPHDAIIYAGVDCSPCYRRRCSNPRCWEAISPAAVIETISQQVARYVWE